MATRAKVRMGDVWDRTTAVLAGRGGVLAGIAALTILLPSIVRDAYVIFAEKGTVTFAVVGGMLSLVVLLVALWGQLTILGLANDPATDRPTAQAAAARRMLPAIGVGVVIGVAAAILSVPIFIAILGSGVDMQAMAIGGAPAVAALGAGRVLFIGLYAMVLGIVALVVGLRLTVLNPVVLHERRGVGAIARSWALTRGHTWRLIGVFVLFIIVLMVAALATQAVVGIVFRLILGADQMAVVQLIAGIAGTVVSTGFSVVALAFIAQLYVALVARQPAAA